MINGENFDGLDIYEKYPYLIRYSLDELKFHTYIVYLDSIV